MTKIVCLSDQSVSTGLTISPHPSHVLVPYVALYQGDILKTLFEKFLE